ncbi:MAG: hypothetical protein NWE92_08270 [Candidatus Bathyarchaeota archaeon]|nr:hypothetical protein [Candidatus Bathyarchaeota archaeon]
MPHVVLNGVVRLEEVFDQLKPIMIREGQTILRTNELYLEHNKDAILVDSLAIEAGKKTAFLAMISSRDDGLVVRLYPKFEVEKTGGVKKILAEIAKQIIEVFPALKVGETNLQDYLK